MPMKKYRISWYDGISVYATMIDRIIGYFSGEEEARAYAKTYAPRLAVDFTVVPVCE